MKQKQLLTCHDAVVTKKQHTTPCSDCPWARKSMPGWLGAYTMAEWLQAAHGEGTSECHTRVDKQCAGFATFRANIVKVPRDPAAFRLPRNTTTVFASDAEFIAHHKEWSTYG